MLPTASTRSPEERRLAALLERELVSSLRGHLAAGHEVWVRVAGSSMWPTLRSGDMVEIAPASVDELEPGDVVAVARRGGLVVHRLVDSTGGSLVLQGELQQRTEPPVPAADLLGVVRRYQRVERGWRNVPPEADLAPTLTRLAARTGVPATLRRAVPFVADRLVDVLTSSCAVRRRLRRVLPLDIGAIRTIEGNRGERQTLLATSGGLRVGTAELVRDRERPVLWLQWIRVRLRARGRGVGLALLGEAGRIAEERGCLLWATTADVSPALDGLLRRARVQRVPPGDRAGVGSWPSGPGRTVPAHRSGSLFTSRWRRESGSQRLPSRGESPEVPEPDPAG